MQSDHSTLNVTYLSIGTDQGGLEQVSGAPGGLSLPHQVRGRIVSPTSTRGPDLSTRITRCRWRVRYQWLCSSLLIYDSAELSYRHPVSGLQGEFHRELEDDWSTGSDLPLQLPVPQVLILMVEHNVSGSFSSSNILLTADYELLIWAFKAAWSTFVSVTSSEDGSSIFCKDSASDKNVRKLLTACLCSFHQLFIFSPHLLCCSVWHTSPPGPPRPRWPVRWLRPAGWCECGPRLHLWSWRPRCRCR